jgi:hypothetical protein
MTRIVTGTAQDSSAMNPESAVVLQPLEQIPDLTRSAGSSGMTKLFFWESHRNIGNQEGCDSRAVTSALSRKNPCNVIPGHRQLHRR